MILVFGNTKGGTGKSTLAAHVAIELMYRGLRLATIDCDGDQGTLSRYWENRRAFMTQARSTAAANPLRRPAGQLPFPVDHQRFSPLQSQPQEVQACLARLIQEGRCDLILMDTAGYDSALSRHGHSLADVLVTPVNDSAIDLDVLINIKGSHKPGELPLSQYATLVWQQRMEKTAKEGRPLEWIVVRNRMHALASRNQATLDQVLRSLAGRIGFHLGPSVAERVIFRELFAYGLTLLDYAHLASSHRTACQEVAAIVDHILRLAPQAARSPATANPIFSQAPPAQNASFRTPDTGRM